MPDFMNVLKQAQLEKDKALQPDQQQPQQQGQQPPSQPDRQQIQNQEPVPQSTEPTDDEIAGQRFREGQHPLNESADEPLSDNPYTWTPEYTQRGFVEEIGTSLMRGFGKHVVGSTGDIAALANGLIPGWEIREGNMLSRELQEMGKEFEAEYKVHMPDEIADSEFTIATFTNPDFWSKTAAEYIPQLVEMVLLSKGAGAVVKGGARAAVKGATRGMTKEALEQVGKKAVVNTSERVAKGAARKATETAGQGLKDWRSLFTTSEGVATTGLEMGSEMLGGGVGMNLIAGLQNAGGLMNEMKDLKGEDGELLYNEQQLAQMAAGTMTENLKYLPIDMLSYGMVYAKNTGQFNKLLNPFNKTQSKKFFNQAEQLVATSKSFVAEITPIMSAVNKVGGRVQRNLNRGRKIASAASKPLFEGVEEQFQETWEEWSKKKAVQRVTGEPLTIDGKASGDSLEDYFSFFMSKENEATRTIAMALGMLGGSASNITAAVNHKAQQQYKNYSKTELFKHGATNEKGFQAQTGFIKQELIDQAIDGNVDSEAWLDALAANDAIHQDDLAEWKTYAKEMTLASEEAKSMGNISVAGKIAYLEHKFASIAAHNNYASALETKNEKIKTTKEAFKRSPKKLKQQLAQIETDWKKAETGFQTQIAQADHSVENILSGEKGDVSDVKTRHVTNEHGNKVAVGLSAEEHHDYYNKTDKEIYEDARTKAVDPTPRLQKMGAQIKDFWNAAGDKLGIVKNKVVGKTDEIVQKTKALKEGTQTEISAGSIATPELIKKNHPNLGEVANIQAQEIAALEGDEQVTAIKEANEKIKEHNKKLKDSLTEAVFNKKNKTESKDENETENGREFKEGGENATEEQKEEEESEEESHDAPKREETSLDKTIESTFGKKVDGNLAQAETEMEKEMADAKIDFKDEQAARAQIKKLVESSKGRISKVAAVEGVNAESVITYLYNLGKNGAFKPESKKDKKTRKANKKRAKRLADKKAELKAAQPTEKNRRQIELADKYNNPEWNKEYQRIIKHDPTQAKVLQEEYDEYLSSTMAEVTYGQNVITQQIAVNQHLRKLYPNTKIQAYAMRNMYESVGPKALGYAIGTSIMIDEKVWNQDEVFMHEFLHVHFALSRGEPETIAILKAALNNTALVTYIDKAYASQKYYSYKQQGWKPGMKKARVMAANMDAKLAKEIAKQMSMKHKNGVPVAKELDFTEQPVLLDELFAHYMQGPMADKFHNTSTKSSKFFMPRTDLVRQFKAKTWWKFIKKKAVDNEDDITDVVQALNDGKEVPIDMLQNHIMQGFVNTLQGREVNLQGRMALNQADLAVRAEENNEVKQRLFNEQAGKANDKTAERLSKIKPEKVITKESDYDIFNLEDPAPAAEHYETEEGFLTQINDNVHMDMGTVWDKDFNAANLKNTEIIKLFVQRFNTLANERRTAKLNALINRSKDVPFEERESLFYDENGELVDATFFEGINLSKFTEKLIDVAKMYDSPIDFIRTLEQSKNQEQQAFVEHLNKNWDDPMDRMVTMHLLYANSEILQGLIHDTDENGLYRTKTPQSRQDPMTINRTRQKVHNSSTDERQAVKDALYVINESTHFGTNEQKAAMTIIKFYGHDSSITSKILNSGYLIVDKRQRTFRDAILALREEINSREPSHTMSEVDNHADVMIQAILNTGKKYASTSVVVGPTGENATTRMFSNHAIKLINKMIVTLKNSENTKKGKAKFITEFSNSSVSIKKNFNPLLESYWDNFHENGEIPLMMLDFGSENAMYGKSKNYKDAGADQQILNEHLQFTESFEKSNPNYMASMDILGDSSRRILMSMPRIDNVMDEKAEFNTNAEKHLAKLFPLYQKMVDGTKNLIANPKGEKLPANFKQFKRGLRDGINSHIEYLENNSETLSLISQFNGLYKRSKDGSILPQLTPEGKAAAATFVFNRAANTFYMHQMTSPGMLLDTITKLHKGQIAPVIALDPNLQVEMIPMADEWKVPPPMADSFKLANGKPDKATYNKEFKKWEETAILMNDGVQYILEEHAESIQALNADFNKGYKLYSHSIEKNSPWFKNQVSQMKGYTTILTKEEVTSGSQQHLYPIWQLLNTRNEKFKADFLAKYEQEYSPKFRDQSSTDRQLPKYIPIMTPVSADKTNLFSVKELGQLQSHFTVEQLKNPATMTQYEGLLDKMYYPKVSGAQNFIGLNGENFGPQQIMDKPYTSATFSIQAIASIPFNQKTGTELNNALKIQTFLSQQKWLNLKTQVFDELEKSGIDSDYKYSKFIADRANKLKSDPYTLRALLNGEMPYSPHVAGFALNQFRAQMIRYGNNLSVPGTYGQTISDMGYKLTSDQEIYDEKGKTKGYEEAFINPKNRHGVNQKKGAEYIGGSSGLNFYGAIPITKINDEGEEYGSSETIPFEAILPKQRKGDKSIARQKFFGENGGRTLARTYLTAKHTSGKRKGKYIRQSTLERLELIDGNNKIVPGAIEALFESKKIFSDQASKNQIGVYIPGETIMMTRIPHNGPAFVGVAEIVGYHTTGASNIIVPSEYTDIIGADHDGDALFVYKQAKLADGTIDRNFKEGYGNWNAAFGMMVDQWLSNNMRKTLEAPLKFEDDMKEQIAQMDSDLHPEKQEALDKIDDDFNNGRIDKKTWTQKRAEANNDADFQFPFTPAHYKEQYNNSVIAKQTIGVAFNSHRALNMLSTFQTELSNGMAQDLHGNVIAKKAKIIINGQEYNKFTDDYDIHNPSQSRIHRSTILANVVLDSTKNGHADKMNLNINTISSAMILANLGFSLADIGYLFNHPLAMEYINKRNDIGNDYIDNGSYASMIYKYNEQYEDAGLNIYGSPDTFSVDVRPLVNGKKNLYYESETNNMAVISLMHYLSKIGDDISTLTDVTSGHKKLENNPFALDKQVSDLVNLLNNNKKDSFDGTNTATLYFPKLKNEKNITDSPEINHYIRVAKEYSKHQKRMNITHNEQVDKIFQMVKNHITSEDLTGHQLKHYTEKIVPFIYARLLGANNITEDEVRSIFDETYDTEGENQKGIPLFRALTQYENELDTNKENIYYEDPKNVIRRDTEKTRSLVFNQGIIYDSKSVRVNPQVLNNHFSDENIKAIQEDFAELPLHLQRQLVLYDLIENAWTGKNSIYPILPKNITTFITGRAEEFQNEDNIKFSQEIIDEAYKVILDIETINPKQNYLPNIYLKEPVTDSHGVEAKEDNAELFSKLGSNKKVKDRILGRENFRVTIHSTLDGKRNSEVIEIIPMGPSITKDDGISAREQARAKSDGTFTNIIRSLITTKSDAGKQFYFIPKIEHLAKLDKSISENAHMVLIKDGSTDPRNEAGKKQHPIPFMNKEVVDKANALLALKKKSSDEGVGRYFRSDYNNYIAELPLTQKQLVNAYEYKRALTPNQENELFQKYDRDKLKANIEAPLWINDKGELVREFTEQELIDGYEKWAKRDAYAAAIITVPIMLELIQRESNYQTAHFSKVMEGKEDIGVMKAWFQTNNIDSSHPATQAIQREIETEFKGFMRERRSYLKRINDVTEALYAEKLGYNPLKTGFGKKVQRAVKMLFKNRDDVYRTLYGNIIMEEPNRKRIRGKDKKRIALLPHAELKAKFKNGQISLAEYEFATTFRLIVSELDPKQAGKKLMGIPYIGPGRLEAFSRKGLLGVLTQSRPIESGMYDVKLNFQNEELTFKEIEDRFRQDLKNNFKNSKEYLQLRIKARRLFKKGVNEDGSMFRHSAVHNHTLLGDGMINNFANNGWANEGDFLSLDLNRALSDFTHASLFVTGNDNFSGFKHLQAKVDGLLLHNQMKGFTNQNQFVRKVYKEYFLKAKKMNPDKIGDKVLDAMVRGNLLYIMGWKLLAVHKGLYVIGNVLIGKYNNIKNQGGKAWLLGEKRYWGVSENGVKHKKAMGVLKTLNFMDMNFYDDVNLQKASGIDSIFTEIALMPMIQSEKWIQGAHYLGMLTEDQWNSFDDNGNYKESATQITDMELAKIENTVKNSHGKGYTPTDQRMVQRYSWGRAIMQFSRFIPTMFYDKFSKEDVNIYGQKHIGSLAAVWEMVAKFAGGEIPMSKMGDYRKSLSVEKRARFDAGLKGLAMVSVALIAGKALNMGAATELAGDANYLVNQEKLEFKMFPSVARTTKDIVSTFVP